jgi:hypothetical protein
METPYERYWRRKKEEIDEPTAVFKTQMEEKQAEINEQLEAAQLLCSHEKVSSGMFEIQCEICGALGG